jgi:hypothetical protein
MAWACEQSKIPRFTPGDAGPQTFFGGKACYAEAYGVLGPSQSVHVGADQMPLLAELEKSPVAGQPCGPSRTMSRSPKSRCSRHSKN